MIYSNKTYPQSITERVCSDQRYYNPILFWKVINDKFLLIFKISPFMSIFSKYSKANNSTNIILDNYNEIITANYNIIMIYNKFYYDSTY